MSFMRISLCPAARVVREPAHFAADTFRFSWRAAVGLCGFIPAAFQSSVSSPCGCSGLRTIPAGVGAFLLPALSHSALQTTAGHGLSMVRVSVAFGGQAMPVHVSTDTKKLPTNSSTTKSMRVYLSGIILAVVLLYNGFMTIGKCAKINIEPLSPLLRVCVGAGAVGMMVSNPTPCSFSGSYFMQ